jgi:hypothetical protein
MSANGHDAPAEQQARRLPLPVVWVSLVAQWTFMLAIACVLLGVMLVVAGAFAHAAVDAAQAGWAVWGSA